MKLVGEQYECREPTGKYAALSFSDVTREDIQRLSETIESEVYTFGLLGCHNIMEKPRHGSWERTHSFSSPKGKNTVKLDHYEGSGLVNIFIHGPKAEEIEIKIKELIPERSLENLAVDLEE